MVRLNTSIIRKGPVNQGRKQSLAQAIKIGPSTPYGYTDEHLTPFGGLLVLEKLLEGLQLQELFESLFVEPARTTMYGSYFFVKGLLILLFIGLHRLYHFVYVEEDPMVLGVMGVEKPPAVSTFWRYIRSLGIISGEETKKFIRSLKNLIPGCVTKVTFTAVGEFFSWDAVSACRARGYRYIIALRRCSSLFARRPCLMLKKPLTLGIPSDKS
jgi:hypothetical protein